MDQYDETSKSSTGLVLFDVSRRLRFNKILNEEWKCNDSQWILRAGDGGLLVYSCKRNGTLRVINPLTMQSHSLEDATLSTKCKISFYLKRYHNNVFVHLKYDSMEKTYQVLVIIGRVYQLRRDTLIVLIYRSVERRWESRDVHLPERAKHLLAEIMNGGISFRRTFVQNQNFYCFSKNRVDVGMYDLNGDCDSRFLCNLGMQGVRQLHQTLGIVIHKGRIIMVCKSKPMDLPSYTHDLIFYEFDELGLQWRSEYKAVVSPHHLPPRVICVGGDYIWIIQGREGHVSNIISIDLDAGKLNVWPELSPFMFNVRNFLSVPLSFCPRP
ncbi:hypothetical protein SUGI_0242700 [Cryptomeria japonica]|nr:hypothetical protein SUGI_0242700 [Cryptomeria japonica]